MVKKAFLFLIAGKKARFLINAPMSIVIVNRIFKLFGVNRSAPLLVNFSSTVSPFKNIDFFFDKNTVTSFCVSGNCYFQALNGIKMGRNILFAPGVKFVSANHDLRNFDAWEKCDPIQIGDNVWIGCNSVILPGVTIADDCIVGAGSIVTKSFLERGSIIAGNPARILRFREIE